MKMRRAGHDANQLICCLILIEKPFISPALLSTAERKAPLSSACDHYLGDEDDDEQLIDLCRWARSLFGELKMLFEMKFIFFFWNRHNAEINI